LSSAILTPQRPAVAVHLFPSSPPGCGYNPLKTLVLLLGLLASFSAFSQNIPRQNQNFVVDIELQTAEQFLELLDRAEQLMLTGVIAPDSETKVTLVLHGPVLLALLRDNYRENKNLVDKAASLSAMEVIDVKACISWMTSNKVNPNDLLPFIETVPYGPAEVQRLLNERGYLKF
jgi:uncharacterized protein